MTACRAGRWSWPIVILFAALTPATPAEPPDRAEARQAIRRLLEDCARVQESGDVARALTLAEDARRRANAALGPGDDDRGRALRTLARLRCDRALARGDTGGGPEMGG
jgi:hypothetical protein